MAKTPYEDSIGKQQRRVLEAAITILAKKSEFYGNEIEERTGLPHGTYGPALEKLEKLGILTHRMEKKSERRGPGGPPRKIYSYNRGGQQKAKDVLKWPVIGR